MAIIELIGEHEISIKFNNSQSCLEWIKKLREIMQAPLVSGLDNKEKS